ncbi:hypothetical protein LIN78_13265 [Leeia sp. TBRC 13508]|uniref:Uncharacterized protein n=1 Tax=Leeia speluncae TaxID=2884804 RepID=A0ABS8D8R0_9NEIS|nr:hypothetical protein [Leeia speluncae]MCB6184512.1 hypothetical protein [Leeia speluncae]
MPAQQEPTSLDAYLNLLKQKGASTASLNQRKHFLRYLVSALEGCDRDDSVAYRHAVDSTLHKMATDETLNFFVSIAREFYPFWNEDLKTVAAMASGDGFALQPINLKVSASLEEIWFELCAAGWDKKEIPCLSDYLSRVEGKISSQDYTIRDYFLRCLMFLMRTQPLQSAVYRSGVNAILMLLPQENVRQAFLGLIREFYPFWQKMLLNETEVSPA